MVKVARPSLVLTAVLVAYASGALAAEVTPSGTEKALSAEQQRQLAEIRARRAVAEKEAREAEARLATLASRSAETDDPHRLWLERVTAKVAESLRGARIDPKQPPCDGTGGIAADGTVHGLDGNSTRGSRPCWRTTLATARCVPDPR
jgi:hypothetical protein